MKNKPTTSSQCLLNQKQKSFSHKEEPKSKLIKPSFCVPESKESNEFSSNISEKKNDIEVCISNSYSFKSGPDYDMFCQPFFHGTYQKIRMPFFRMPMGDQSKFQSCVTSMQEKGNDNNFKFAPNYFLLNRLDNEKEDFFKEIKDESKNKNDNKNNKCNFLFNNLRENFYNNWIQENNNLSLNTSMNKEINSSNNSGTKFFTNHNYGYKCSCSKTKCNRKYCECYNSGNYCVDCNCKDCNNRPPVNSYTNKHPTDEQSKSKKEKVICTCTKSGCNKNYCECFKIGQKCSSLCRCIGCENNDQIQSKKYNFNYQCNTANSIYIIKNKIFVENMKEKIRDEIFGDNPQIKKYDFVGICKKRKREENKNEEEEKNFGKNIKNKKIENSEEFNLFNDSLFDQNGKVILRHINLFQKFV
jgi:hypothetical protein